MGVAVQQGTLGGGTESISNILGIKAAPSLTRSVQYARDLAPDVREILEGQIQEQREILTEDVGNYDAWLTLAIRYKQAGDLNKARDVWEYLASIHPEDVVPRHNLGDLYHHFLNDYPKAEMYYKQALQFSPTNSFEYLALHELYRYSYKQDTTAAVDILEEGIKNVSESQPIDLYIALANYYADKGEIAKAIGNYTEARRLAQDAGNTSLVQQLNAEIAKWQ
jgi:tetratricopeptide (TPR) repeat protein